MGAESGVHAELPPELTSFVGRRGQIRQVTELLAQARLVTLTGSGGVGKTRLALRVARDLASRYDGGVTMVELAGRTDPELVTRAVAEAYGLHDRLTEWQVDDLVSALGRERLLLVLDDCEHLLDACAALVDELLRATANLSVLATSRQPLGVHGEHLLPVPPLTMPADDVPTAPEATSYEAVSLFVERARAATGDFDLTASNVVDVVRLCRRLDGVPLAIELAAARLRVLSLPQLLARLDDRFALLTDAPRAGTGRRRTLQSMVDWSYDLCTPAEQRAWSVLSVFEGGVELDAAEHVWSGLDDGGDPSAPGSALDLVSALVDKSVVFADDDGSHVRYRMLETIREYCLEQLAGAGESDQVRRAHAEYFLGLAQDAEPELRRASQLHWMRVLITENENLNAAVRWAIDQRDADLALRLGGALGYYWFLRGKHLEQRPLADSLLALAWPDWRQGPAEDSARSAAGRAGGGQGQHRPVLAAEHAWAVVCCVIVVISQTLDIDRVRALVLAAAEASESAATPPHPMMAMARPLIAQLDLDFDGALAAMGPALAAPDPWVAALARVLRAGIACGQGRLDDAAADCVTAERAFRDLGERWGAASALVQRGYVAGLRGDRDTEIAALNQASKLAHEMSAAEDDEADMLGQLALARMATGDLEAARTDLGRARKIAERIGHDDSFLQAISADLARLTGDLVSGRAKYEAALRELDQRPKPFQPIKAVALAGLALVTMAEGNPAGVVDLLSTALRTAAEYGSAPGIATVLEATAMFVLADATDGGDTGAGGLSDRAGRAAKLLGAAHGVRGGADPRHPDIARATAGALNALGQAGFDGCYARGLGLTREDAISLASACLSRSSQAATP